MQPLHLVSQAADEPKRVAPLVGTLYIDGPDRKLALVKEQHEVTVLAGTVMRRPFPFYHEPVEGFQPYAIGKRLQMMQWASRIIDDYAKSATRRADWWAVTSGLAELETRKILGRPPMRAELRLLTDVVSCMWRVSAHVRRVKAIEAAIEHAEGPYHVAGAYYANEADARFARRCAAERAVREEQRRAAVLAEQDERENAVVRENAS